MVSPLKQKKKTHYNAANCNSSRETYSIETINELSFGLEDTTYTAVQANCAVKSSAVPEVTQSRNFNCTKLRNFPHTLDLTAQL